MRSTRLTMGMPVTVEIVGADDTVVIDRVFAWFDAVDRRFSTYKTDSEISRINRGTHPSGNWSAEMREIIALCDATRRESDGYFNARTPAGAVDPSGVVKGWTILGAARIIDAAGQPNYYVDAGGDIQSAGVSGAGHPWRVGVRNPFNACEIVKVVEPRGHGVATSGTYTRGQHIYVPGQPDKRIDDVVSLTVVGPDILEADRFATAAFAMGRAGIGFIERIDGLEGYEVLADRTAIATSGFEKFCPS
jgi:thiamine biosynthesis lipoprotein